MKNNIADITALFYLQLVIILLKLANVPPISSWGWWGVTAFTTAPLFLGTIIIAAKKAKE
jgi:hypothetical protein